MKCLVKINQLYVLIPFLFFHYTLCFVLQKYVKLLHTVSGMFLFIALRFKIPDVKDIGYLYLCVVPVDFLLQNMKENIARIVHQLKHYDTVQSCGTESYYYSTKLTKYCLNTWILKTLLIKMKTYILSIFKIQDQTNTWYEATCIKNSSRPIYSSKL